MLDSRDNRLHHEDSDMCEAEFLRLKKLSSSSLVLVQKLTLWTRKARPH